MFGASTLLTHGCLTWWTVKLHYLMTRKGGQNIILNMNALINYIKNWTFAKTGRNATCLEENTSNIQYHTASVHYRYLNFFMLCCCVILTFPPWLGQESGCPVVTPLIASAQSSLRLVSGLLFSTSIKLVMKKLLWSAATPFSGRMEVWRQMGQDRVRLWAGM